MANCYGHLLILSMFSLISMASRTSSIASLVTPYETMTSPERSLLELRREIDRIDIALHDLIMLRTDTVRRIADIKDKSGLVVMQPGREADIMRRLVERHSGQFPASALVQIWREIIAAVTAMQGPHSVAINAAENEQGYWDLARTHFGSQTSMTSYAVARDVVSQVSAGRTSVGVLPIPSEDDSDPWWPSLCVPGAPRIVIRLPFAGRGNARGGSIEAYAIGRNDLERTGKDRTILAFETSEALSRTALNDMLRKAKLKPTLTTSCKQDRWLHFAEVEDFVSIEDARLNLLEARDIVQRVLIIGAYAMPLSKNDLQIKPDGHIGASEPTATGDT